MFRLLSVLYESARDEKRGKICAGKSVMERCVLRYVISYDISCWIR